jgi:hypothetical protein
LTCGFAVELPHQYSAAGGLDHGYALTLHASQGLTIDRTHVLANDALFYEAGLVALSRHRDTCHVHLAGPIEPVDDREMSHVRVRGAASGTDPADRIGDLGRALRLSRADEAALDHMTPPERSGQSANDRSGR